MTEQKASTLDRRVYEDLRERLVDRTRRNKLLHFKHGTRATLLRIVDNHPDRVLEQLVGGVRLRFMPLPDPELDPKDESTPEFRSALAAARQTDDEYRQAVDALDADESAVGREHRIERDLRDRVRASLGLRPRPSSKSFDPIAHAKANGINPTFDLALLSTGSVPRLSEEWLQTLLLREPLGARLSRISKNTRAIEQETGVSTLHLAFGFLEWFESESSDDVFVSPLLLLPVGLERKASRGGEDEYVLTASEEAPITNLSLELRLRGDFHISLPVLGGDASGLVEQYFEAIEEIIRPFPRWRVRRYITLAPFSFARIAMYRDLDVGNWTVDGDPSTHHLVQPLLRGIGNSSHSPEGAFASEHEIDSVDADKFAPILVHDADSSQHSAIIDAMRGQNLVVEGPPGTGKSQTIANLIANKIYSGGTVLFLSEKMAALDVVKSRLDRVGLGIFCLLLHAAGAKPSAVIDALRKRDSQVFPRVSTPYDIEHSIQTTRAEIRNHIDVIHCVAGPSGETIHALIGRISEFELARPELVGALRPVSGELPISIGATSVLNARQSLEALEATMNVAGRPDWNPSASPFVVMGRTDLFPDERDDLVSSLRELEELVARLQGELSAVASVAGEEVQSSLPEAERLLDRIDSLNDPANNVNMALVKRLTTAASIESGLWLARCLDTADSAAKFLASHGLKEITAVHLRAVEGLAEFVEPLRIAQLRAGEISGYAYSWESLSAELKQRSDVVGTLAGGLALDFDPTLGEVRRALAIATFIADLDPLNLRHRRLGLHRHVDLLAAAAERQSTVLHEIERISANIDVSGISSGDLRRAARSLQDRSLWTFFRSDVRLAKRAFRQRWRNAPLPRAREWHRYFTEAATTLDELESMQRDSTLNALIGDQFDVLETSFRRLADVAAWQRRAHDYFSVNPLHATRWMGILVSVDADQASAIAELKQPARDLVRALEAVELNDEARWSDVLQYVADRASALREIVRLADASGIDPEVELSKTRDLVASGVVYQSTTNELASARAKALTDGLTLDLEMAKASVEFAANVVARFPSVADQLLADGWTLAISHLRSLSRNARLSIIRVNQVLGRLAELGLGRMVTDVRSNDFNAVRGHLAAFVAAANDLPAFLSYSTTRRRCEEDPLAGPLLRALDQKGLDLRNLTASLEWLVAWTIVRRHADSNRRIFNRPGSELTAARRKFADSDLARIVVDAHKVASIASKRKIPSGRSVGSRRDWTDRALLDNEFTKQRRHVPVRDLLSRASEAVLALTPCVMMSPLTVAQYLKPGRVSFDLVIMDEASQIKPEDALGALLRGKQVVVVGDPKQLPPTNFFDRALEEADEEGDSTERERLAIEDRVAAESILDLALQSFRPARRLRWHYRSQHEDLIAFSNREFYDDNLIVFPAAEPPSETLGIEVVEIGGRWRERVNAEEAVAVARAVVSFMRTHPSLSHGVVTMNQPQRELIEAEIDRLAVTDDAVSEYREEWEQRLEPPFVKNLENVQGDERDVVFISLGWGATPGGAVHQRFFPVNRHEDGHRRLNVLFTRAKRKVVLFVSIAPEQIHVGERTARGVRVLRDYLSYAREGRLEVGHVAGGEAESPFEESVAKALRARGYNIELQVGVAGYRVDIAVRHPTATKRYVIGIECDGARYHSAKSARDRDRLREEALKRLGWNLVRVWSTDWFRDRAGQIERLVIDIDRAIEECDVRSPTGRLVPVDSRKKTASNVGARNPRHPMAAPELPLERPGELVLAKRGDDANEDLTARLRQFRETTIFVDLPGSEPGRCILRDEMISAIVEASLDDPDDFRSKIPEWLRSRTDGRQMKYLEQICEIVADQK